MLKWKLSLNLLVGHILAMHISTYVILIREQSSLKKETKVYMQSAGAIYWHWISSSRYIMRQR